MSKADKLLKRIEFYEKMASAQKPEADDLLNKASLFERLALYSDSKSFLKALAQREILMEGDKPSNPQQQPYSDPGWEEARNREFGSPTYIPKPEPIVPLTPQQEAAKAIQGPADVTFTPDPKKDQIRAVPPIDRKDQEAVYRFVTEERIGIPGRIDGSLGKDTRAALEAIKNYFAKLYPQNPRMTDQQAITAAKAPRRQ